MQFLSKLFSTYIGIDLGTANCLVYVRDQNVIISEPSVVAIKTSTGEVIAVGHAAKAMIGKTPTNMDTIRPLKDGVIANFEITGHMLRHFIQKVMKEQPWYKRCIRPHLMIAVPSGITEVEKRAVEESARHAGAASVRVVPEPMAAAVGVGLPTSESTGNMIIDIGGGTTEVAIISIDGMVQSRSIRVAGDAMDDAIIQYMRRQHNMIIGTPSAERIKKNIGSAYPVKDNDAMDITGMDIVSRMPKTIRVTAQEIRMALQEPVTSIAEAVRSTIEHCPPELLADLFDRGIMLAGGGALLTGLDQLISEETGLPVLVAEEPLNAVVLGVGEMVYNDRMWI